MLLTVQIGAQRGARKPLECLIFKHIMATDAVELTSAPAAFNVARRFHFYTPPGRLVSRTTVRAQIEFTHNELPGPAFAGVLV
jgi:hypothetical protein